MADFEREPTGTGDIRVSVLDGIRDAAIYSHVDQVVLFGSRARGTHRPRSDIDLAIRGGDGMRFRRCMEEDMPTLLMFDVVELDYLEHERLRAEIETDGIVLYEKSR